MISEMIIESGGNKKVNAIYNGFTMETDQPNIVGGDNSAPEPFSFFLASIGTCAGIYVYSFCQAREIPTDGIRIIQRMHWNPDTHMINKIELDIKLNKDFPEKYKKAVIRSANLCAVKKHLDTPPEFEITTSLN